MSVSVIGKPDCKKFLGHYDEVVGIEVGNDQSRFDALINALWEREDLLSVPADVLNGTVIFVPKDSFCLLPVPEESGLRVIELRHRRTLTAEAVSQLNTARGPGKWEYKSPSYGRRKNSRTYPDYVPLNTLKEIQH